MFCQENYADLFSPSIYKYCNNIHCIASVTTTFGQNLFSDCPQGLRHIAVTSYEDHLPYLR